MEQLYDELKRRVKWWRPAPRRTFERPRRYREGNILAIYPVDSETNERVWHYDAA